MMARLEDVHSDTTRGGPSPAPPVLFAPSRLGRYEIQGELGRGGMGRVLRAYDPTVKRAVALKVLDRPEIVARLQREAQAAARLQHPNVVTLYEFGTDQGLAYLAMELIEGEPLEEAWKGWPRSRRLEVLQTVALAVGYCHRQGVVHRDLKPGNVMVTPEGGVKVMDLGLAHVVGESRLTRTGTVMGTPVYMATEQMRGELVGPQADVYSLGVMLYEAITGRLPFTGATPEEVYQKVLTQDPVPPARLDPTVPPELDLICQKAMAKEPERRYADGGEMAEEFRRWRSGAKVRARPLSRVYRLKRRLRRNPWGWAVAAGLSVALVAGAGVMAYQGVRHAREQRALQVYRDALGPYYDSLGAMVLGDPVAPRGIEIFEDRLAEARRIDPGFDGGWPERALFAFLLGDRGRAEECLRVALVREPSHPIGRLVQGMLLAEDYERDLSRAETEVLKEDLSLARQQNRPLRIAVPVEELEAANPSLAARREQAVSLIRAGLEPYGSAEPVWIKLFLAELDSLIGELDSAEVRLAALPTARAKAFLGRIRERRGDLEGAERVYAESLALDAGHLPAVRGLAVVRGRLGFERVDRGDPSGGAKLDEAVAGWTFLAQRGERPEEALAERASIRTEQGTLGARRGEDPRPLYDAAIQDLEGIGPLTTASAATLLGRAYRLRGWAEMARGGDPEPFFRRGEEALQWARSLFPDYVPALDGLGCLYTDWGRWRSGHGEDPVPSWRRARDLLLEAISIYPASLSARVNLGAVYFYLGQEAGRGEAALEDLRSSVACWEAVLERLPDSVATWTGLGLAHACLARCGWEPERSYAEAIRAFREALARNPDHAPAHTGIGLALTGLGDVRADEGKDAASEYGEAVTSFRTSISIDPHDAETHIGLGAALHRLADCSGAGGGNAEPPYEEAAAAFEAAIRVNPAHWQAHANLARVLAVLGRFEGALSEINRAIELNPGQPDLAALRQGILQMQSEAAPEFR